VLLDIPFVEGSIDQDMDADTGEWLQWWELPLDITLCYIPLSCSSPLNSSQGEII
jgi:hypothetical protein